jgi:hypothetical protein
MANQKKQSTKLSQQSVLSIGSAERVFNAGDKSNYVCSMCAASYLNMCDQRRNVSLCRAWFLCRGLGTCQSSPCPPARMCYGSASAKTWAFFPLV